MMILEANEVCKLTYKCPHTDTCYGAKTNRQTIFNCEFVENGEIITDVGFRNPYDQTGKMKVIME